MSNNYCFVASAGAGKTTYIVNDAHKRALTTSRKIAIVTFTSYNQYTEELKYINIHNHIPRNVVISGWYSFLLNYFIRPFKGDVIECLYDIHTSLAFTQPHNENVNGKKRPHYKKGDLKTKYLTSNNNIYKDYLAEFAFECLERNRKIIINRLNQIFDTIYFDESQDLCAYDFEIIKTIIKDSTINCVITIDPRQHTYSSSNSSKHKKYVGRMDLYCLEKINNKRKSYISINTTKFKVSHRCNIEICTFSNNICSDFSPTVPCNCIQCSERKSYFKKVQGVFLVHECDVPDFVAYYNPTILTANKNIKVRVDNCRLNFGECKGDEFECTLIYPTKDMVTWLKKDLKLAPMTKAKFYVAVTRAIFTVGIVVSNSFENNRFDLPIWYFPK